MKDLIPLLASYGSYHKNQRNVATHFVGIPLVVCSVFIPLGWPRLSGVSAGDFCYIGLMVYYMMLDFTLGLAALVAFFPVLFASDLLSQLAFGKSLVAFLILFIVGWSFQFLGHHFEGKKPAFTDNLFQLLVGPLFITAELLFLLGMKTDLKEKLGRR